jgi:hypothetical protein
MKAILVSLLFALGAVISPLSFAENHMYLDLGLGNADVEVDDLEGDDTYFKITIGGQIGDGMYVEGGFMDLGEAEDGPFSAEADGLFGALKFGTETGNGMLLYGRIGLYMWDAEGCVSGFGCADDDGTDIFFGGGVAWKVGPGTLGAELQILELDDVDVTTIGAAYNFPLNM